MTKRWMSVLAVLLLAPAAAQAQDAPPPGCRWQNGDGGVILACKDSKGYWRRSGDDEIVGYDPPPRPKPRPAPAAKPAVAAAAPVPAPAANPAPVPEAAPAPVQPEATSTAPAPAEAPEAAPAAAAPEPPAQPLPPLTPLGAFFHWLLGLWRSLGAWIAGLF